MPGYKGGGNSMFLSAKMGALKGKNQSGEKVEYFAYSARIISIKLVRDTFEDKEIWKFVIGFREEDESTTMLQFIAESWFSMGFWSRADRIDYEKDTMIGASGGDEGSKVTFCWIKQQNESGEWTVVKKDDNFPRPVKTKLGTQTVSDYTPVWEEIAKRWAKIIKATKGFVEHAADEGSPLAVPKEVSVPPPKTKQSKTVQEINQGEDDDLPF